MLDKVSACLSKTALLVANQGKPKLLKFWHYARVEMRPPNVNDFNLAMVEANRLVEAAKAGQWKNIRMKDGFLNAAVTLEVLCWFFVGEIIGRRSLIGYSRVPGAYMQSH